MLFLYHSTYPMSKINEVTDIFLDIMKNDPPPDFVQVRNIYTAWGGDGIQVWTIYDIKDEKAMEGTKEITKRLVRYSEVEGLRIESNVVLPIEEALAVGGREMP